jgi:hypothetical protein
LTVIGCTGHQTLTLATQAAIADAFSSHLERLVGGSSDQANRARSLFARESKDFDFDSVKHEWMDRLDQVRALAAVADLAEESPAGFRLAEIDLSIAAAHVWRLVRLVQIGPAGATEFSSKPVATTGARIAIFGCS